MKTPTKKKKSKASPAKAEISSHSSGEEDEEKKATVASGKTSDLSNSLRKQSTLKKKGGEKRDIEAYDDSKFWKKQD